jgi:signal transduction histidine kinase
VLALGVTAALLLVAVYQLHESLIAQSTAVIHAATEIRRDVAVAHLWLEEYLSGDQIDFQEILASLDHAGALADALLEGGQAGRPRRWVKPLADPELRRTAGELRRWITALRTAARERQEGLRRGEDIGIGSAVDARYDRMFGRLEDAADALERGAETREARAGGRARLAFVVLLAGWAAVVAVAAQGLRSREAALRRSEAQLLEGQKLEAVGRLASGLAHDINNYITAMTSQCELVQMRVPAGDPIAAKMDLVLSTAGKVTALIRRLLAFSRQQPAQPELVDLDRIIEDLRPMLQGLAEGAVELAIRSDGKLWPVSIDPAQVEQVVVNLLLNAREASPDGGLVTLETANCRLDAADYVMTAVSDHGTGIAPEIQRKIFEPFFTTRDESSARGLGLATVYGIARQNGGHVTFSTVPGRGTTFRVYLPRAVTPEAVIAL